MKKIKFNPTGPALSARLEFIGLFAAVYSLEIAEKDSNQIIFQGSGNNQNNEDDRYDLPGTPEKNDGRIIIISAEFYGLDPINFKDYKISISVFQGEHLLDKVTEKGKLTGKTQSSLQFIMLVANV